jgi:hypothetical protein
MCIVSHSILVKYETQNGVVCAVLKRRQSSRGERVSEPQNPRSGQRRVGTLVRHLSAFTALPNLKINSC